ncbi:MAG: arsenite methyltransferase [Chloroflexi bacterium]|nr:arsenite methyltransferase [Chloroflexota bacterium]
MTNVRDSSANPSGNKVIASGAVQSRGAMSESSQIREAVQDHYNSVAERGAEAGCCGPADAGATCCGANESGLYDAEQIAAIPAEAAAASAGCGNPVAIGDLKPGETVVDLGSGGGIDCFLAAKMVGEEGRVVGIDMTIKMIELARENAKKVGADNVEFRLSPIEAIPMRDGEADVVISNCVLALVPDKSLVFDEAFRVLRPGGRMFISDMVTVGGLPAEIVNDPEQWVQCVAGAEDRDTYLKRIEDAGFSPVQVEEDVALDVGDGTKWAGNVHSISLRAVKPAV